ncbi:1-phosphofructokinase family hexose kinase [Flavihumibacter sp. ZG627]|uniref:1-phosphofructokinase family hexose kinase n=1 Tax=Flavihumibacter sp. ZG627 TaxID=1463156 RepID=UPI00057DCD60|nr:1-phosphofructokinase family hexose kinase [Flavihumibacter sp. ZG627]KIC91013.1 phosphofructokinase [Flavihumibacter sp. ZG627]
MILTITVNPAVDKSTSTEKLVAEKKMRCTEMVVEAGGGGINVSKALSRLGAPNKAIITSGGINGMQLEKCLQEAGIQYFAVPIHGDTRENVVLLETSSNSQYRLVLPGPTLSAKVEDAILDALASIQEKPEMIIASGSLPPGFAPGFYARVASYSQRNGIRCIIDCSGEPLLLAARAGVYLLKPNLNELSQLAGRDHLETDQVLGAAKQLLHEGRCEVVVVSMGPQGALMVTPGSHLLVPAPTVKKISTVGAGDSMVAGMAYQLMKNESLENMIRFGIACGTAATMQPGTKLFDPADAYRLYGWLQQQ